MDEMPDLYSMRISGHNGPAMGTDANDWCCSLRSQAAKLNEV